MLIVALVACHKANQPSFRVFASPEDASTALVEAAKSGDPNALLAIFGAESKAIIFSGDAVQDKAAVDKFNVAYGVMHRWRKMLDGTQVLLIGADNFPFPIPLKRGDGGQWFFDTAAGKEEILSRRIGRNELAIIEICGAVGDAQAEYFSQPHDTESKGQFALKFISDGGKHNGLYWEVPEGQPNSPLGPLAAFATAEGYSIKPNSYAPFHGYYFHMLTRQGAHAQRGAKDYLVNGKMVGGFAFVAYPAEYGSSGIMTFINNQDGVLLQKDLGTTTTEIATAMKEFDPDAGWSPVQQRLAFSRTLSVCSLRALNLLCNFAQESTSKFWVPTERPQLYPNSQAGIETKKSNTNQNRSSVRASGRLNGEWQSREVVQPRVSCSRTAGLRGNPPLERY
jgi:hypothetical protein